jgi:hypothetical protein
VTGHKHFRSRTHALACYVGICPACAEPVLWDDPDGPVWTCPRDPSGTNPFRDCEAPYTEAELDASGAYSQCGEDHGGPCVERLPLHSACYEKGDY